MCASPRRLIPAMLICVLVAIWSRLEVWDCFDVLSNHDSMREEAHPTVGSSVDARDSLTRGKGLIHFAF